MYSKTTLLLPSLKGAKPLLFSLGLVLLIGSWVFLYGSEAQFTESHLVGYYCCVSEQDLPAPGTLERMVNDFFRYAPGKQLLPALFILTNVSFFLAIWLKARQLYWLPFLFIVLNIIYLTIDFDLVGISWLMSDWLIGPQTSVYKGYLRTGPGIILHLIVWGAFFMTLAKVRLAVISRQLRG